MENKTHYIFIFTHSPQFLWYEVFASAFKSLGKEYKTVLFVHGAEDVSAVKAQCEDYDIIIDMLEGFNVKQGLTVDNLLSYNEISKLEKSTAQSFLWDDIRTDRWLRKKEFKGASSTLQYLNHAASIIKCQYNEKQPLLAFGESTMAIYRFAKRLFENDGKYHLAVLMSRYFSRFRVEHTWNWEWNETIKLYKHYILHGIPEDIADQMEKLYEDIISNVFKPIYFENFKAKGGSAYTEFSSLGLKQVFDKIRIYLDGPSNEERRRNPRFSIIEASIGEKLKRIYNNRKFKAQYLKLADSEPPSKFKFATLFLHYGPEYTLDSLGRFYRNQEYLVNNIAAAIPADTLLVVKDHPAMIGLRSTSFYNTILKNKNVVLVNHSYSSLDLIKKSELIFTIVGTTAMEAMFLGTPAIMFGKCSFNDLYNVEFAQDFWTLPELILKQVNKAKLPAEEVKLHSLSFLAAKYKSSYQGQLPFDVPSIHAFVADKKNLDLVKKGFLKELKKKGIIEEKEIVQNN